MIVELTRRILSCFCPKCWTYNFVLFVPLQLLTTCVKFHVIPLRQLTEAVRAKLVTYEDHRLLEHLEVEMKYQLHPIPQVLSRDRHHDLKFADDVFVMPYGRVGRGTIGRGLEVYDCNRGIWKTTSCRINTNLFPRAATTTLDNFLYVAGGWTTSEIRHASIRDLQMKHLTTEMSPSKYGKSQSSYLSKYRGICTWIMSILPNLNYFL